MRAYLKFTTVLLMGFGNFATYLILARANETVLGTGLSLLVFAFGTATAAVLIRTAMRILPDYVETSTNSNLGENSETERTGKLFWNPQTGKEEFVPFNILADASVPENEIRLLNPDTGEVIARIYNVKVEQK